MRIDLGKLFTYIILGFAIAMLWIGCFKLL